MCNQVAGPDCQGIYIEDIKNTIEKAQTSQIVFQASSCEHEKLPKGGIDMD